MQSCNIAKQKICFDHKNLLFRAKLQSENDVDLGWTLQPNLTTFCPAEAKYFALCMLFSWRKLKFAYLRQNQFVLPAWIWENYFEFVHIFVLPMQNNYEFVCIFFCIHVHVFWCFKEVETFVCIPDSTGSLWTPLTCFCHHPHARSSKTPGKETDCLSSVWLTLNCVSNARVVGGRKCMRWLFNWQYGKISSWTGATAVTAISCSYPGFYQIWSAKQKPCGAFYFPHAVFTTKGKEFVKIRTDGAHLKNLMIGENPMHPVQNVWSEKTSDDLSVVRGREELSDVVEQWTNHHLLIRTILKSSESSKGIQSPNIFAHVSPQPVPPWIRSCSEGQI